MKISINKILELNNKLNLGDYGVRSANRYMLSLNYLIDECKKNKDVCEIGPGGVIAYIATHSEANTSAIVNPNEKHWDNIFKKYNINLFKWDLNSTLESSNLKKKFDCIIFLETIEHLNRWPEKVIEDIEKLLKPDGILLLSTPNLVRISNRIRMLLGKSPSDPFKYTLTGDHHVREFTLEELLNFFPKNKWDILDADYSNSYFFTKKLLKPLLNFFDSLFGRYIFIKAKKR